ncbi:transmembrane protein 17-like [Lineus longissimus]|uniref:transmembrane protein 17-like n=1 Tax=Lineus longissimus TaxID=88925 RepID=UPI002B4F4D50
MADTLRKTVTKFTDVVFPVSKTNRENSQHHALRAGNEYVSSLPLQMAFYFNGFYFPFWCAYTILGLYVKYNYLDTLYKIIQLAVVILIVIVEIIRLYVGYLGNLSEKVPELAGSWLLTILISIPLTLVLLFNDGAYILPPERACNIIQLCFLLFEVIAGYFAIRAMVNLQVAKFHLKQFYDLENLDRNEGLDFYENNGAKSKRKNAATRA